MFTGINAFLTVMNHMEFGIDNETNWINGVRPCRAISAKNNFFLTFSAIAMIWSKKSIVLNVTMIREISYEVICRFYSHRVRPSRSGE